MSVRVRLAPSPTGNLHIGTARTAVFNWLFARHQQGKFILRIEDTDLERSREEYTENILEGLTWLGLNWDEGPLYQSQRLELYQQATQKLLDKKLAYRCYCTEAELEEMRAAQKARKEAPRYDNRHRNLTAEEQAAFEAEGRQAVIRFKIDDNRVITWNDMVRGKVTWKGSDLGGDMVISRAASGGKVGQPLYNMAVVIDDMDMEITHVIRGEDHIANTAKQILLYEALEGKVPEFSHTPLILNTEGRKLSKRDGVTSISDFKELGFLPEALANYMSLLGWTPADSTKEIFTLPEAATQFSFERVNKAGAKFDWDKLDWINSQYLHIMPVEQLTDKLIPIWQNAGYEFDPEGDRSWLEQLAALIGPSLTRLKDAVEMSKLFFSPTVELDEEATAQMQKEDSVNSINSILEMIDSDKPLRVGDAQKMIKRVTQQIKVKKGIVMRSLRASLTGAMNGPDLIQSWLLLHEQGLDIVRFKKALGQEVPETKKTETSTKTSKGTVVLETATPESPTTVISEKTTIESPAAKTPQKTKRIEAKIAPLTVGSVSAKEVKTPAPPVGETQAKPAATTSAPEPPEPKAVKTPAPPVGETQAKPAATTSAPEPPEPKAVKTPAPSTPKQTETASSTTTPEVTTPAPEPPTVATQENLSPAAQVETQTSDVEPVEIATAEETINTEQLEKIKQQLLNIFANFPEYISQFYQGYKSQLRVVALIIVTILTFRLIIGLLEVLEEIPILSFSFKSVGMGYTVWFIFRFLLRKSDRKELLEKVQNIKSEIVGRGESE